MATDVISLDEVSWRLERSGISGRAFAELLLETEPLLLGLFPGKDLPRPVDLSRATSVRVRADNAVLADEIRWTGVKISWRELGEAFQKRGVPVSWTWYRDITPEVLQRFSQPDRSRRLLGDPRPHIAPIAYMRPASEAQPSQRRASREWFAAATYTGFVPLSGKAPRAKRGPRSGKRQNTAAAIRNELSEKIITVREPEGNARKNSGRPLRGEPRHGAQSQERRAGIDFRRFDFDKRQIATAIHEGLTPPVEECPAMDINRPVYRRDPGQTESSAQDGNMAVSCPSRGAEV